MKSAPLLVAAILLLSLGRSTGNAKGTSGIGIYCVINQVIFDADGPAPNSVRISGLFVVPVPVSSGQYKAPQRGYLYFRIPPGAAAEREARREWDQLKAFAGTGKVVGFAFYWVPNPDDPGGNPHHSLEVRVRTEGDATPPDVYPAPHPKGIVQAGDRDTFDETIAAEFVPSLTTGGNPFNN